MNIEEARLVKMGVVRKRKRIQLTNVLPDCKQWILRLRNGQVYLEPADDVLAFSRQADRIHLSKAAEVLGLKEGDKYAIMENENGLVLLKVNIIPEEVLWHQNTMKKENSQKKQ